MDDIYRKAIKRKWNTIISGVTKEQASSIMDFLVENDILNEDTREWIERERSKACINTKLFGLVSKKGHRAFLLLIEALFQNQLDSIANKLLTYVAAQSSEQPFVATPSSPATIVTKANQDDITECNVCMNDTKTVALIPCGHTLCSQCANTILNEGSCCFCKRDVTSTLRIFI